MRGLVPPPVRRWIMLAMSVRAAPGPLCMVLIAFCLAATPFAHTQADKEEVGAIVTALQSRDYAKATQMARAAVQRFPRNSQLWTLLGIALSDQKSEKEALAAFRHALSIAPDSLAALEGAAQIEYQAGSADAMPHLRHILQLRPDDPTTHAMLAALAYRQKDCATAVEHFGRSGTLLESEPSAVQQYGVCLLQLKQTEKAIGLFRHDLELHRADSAARRRLAAVQLEAGRAKDSLATLAPMLENQPEASTLQLASAAYEAAGDTPHAVSTLRQAIVRDPRNVDLYVDFANISMDHQSFQVGVDVINSGLGLLPASARLYLTRGVLYVQMSEYDKAEADFQKANQLDPQQSIGSAAQGLKAAQTNDLSQALATVQAKLAKNPDDAFLLYLQANILTQRGPEPGSAEAQQAIQSALKAVALQPNLSAARDVLAKLYLQAGQTQQAVAQCRQALRDNPKDQTALYHLIQALRKSGSQKEIPDLLKQLAQLREDERKQEAEHNRYKLIEENDAPTGNASQ